MSQSVSIRLDHIALFAPSLDEGVAYVRDMLGVEPSAGGAHPQMGTHNRLLRLGDDMFLEVIARDPEAPRPRGHRAWFDLGDDALTQRHWDQGLRLRGMVARTGDLARATAIAPEHLGAAMRLTRGTRTWQFAVREDGRLPCDGALPHVMDWGAPGAAGPALPDLGCRLVDLVLETPLDLSVIAALHDKLAFARAPRIRCAAQTRLIAAIETPRGVRIL